MSDPLLLCLETATSNCSVALIRGEKILATRNEIGNRVHSQYLSSFIDQVLNESNHTLKDLRGVVVSKGPGSYTGLRIGTMTAKGLSFGLDIPILAVNTLQALAAGYIQHNRVTTNTMLCPMIDARRMEVYTATFDHNLNFVTDTQAVIIGENVLNDLPTDKNTVFFGPGIEKCRSVLEGKKHTTFYGEWVPMAEFLLKPALKRYVDKQFEDPAIFEPLYYKDYVPEHKSFKIDRVLGKRTNEPNN